MLYLKEDSPLEKEIARKLDRRDNEEDIRQRMRNLEDEMEIVINSLCEKITELETELKALKETI